MTCGLRVGVVRVGVNGSAAGLGNAVVELDRFLLSLRRKFIVEFVDEGGVWNLKDVEGDVVYVRDMVDKLSRTSVLRCPSAVSGCLPFGGRMQCS